MQLAVEYYLFSSHAIYLEDGRWQLQCNMRRADDMRPNSTRLSDARIDYVLPGYLGDEDGGFYRLSKERRETLAAAMVDLV